VIDFGLTASSDRPPVIGRPGSLGCSFELSIKHRDPSLYLNLFVWPFFAPCACSSISEVKKLRLEYDLISLKPPPATDPNFCRDGPKARQLPSSPNPQSQRDQDLEYHQQTQSEEVIQTNVS